jgi:hypothetical protein
VGVGVVLAEQVAAPVAPKIARHGMDVVGVVLGVVAARARLRSMTTTILPATVQRWDDVVAVFGRRGNDPGWCWCRRFLDPP